MSVIGREEHRQVWKTKGNRSFRNEQMQLARLEVLWGSKNPSDLMHPNYCSISVSNSPDGLRHKDDVHCQNSPGVYREQKERRDKRSRSPEGERNAIRVFVCLWVCASFFQTTANNEGDKYRQWKALDPISVTVPPYSYAKIYCTLPFFILRKEWFYSASKHYTYL